jgi:type VI secretion system secreted protein Hcp
MRNRVLLLCLVSVLLLVPRVNWAAERCFLYLDGIPGESQDALHANWIDVESWSIGETNTSTPLSVGGGGAAGKVSFQDFHFVMLRSVASPLLLSAASSGRFIKEARLECQKNIGNTQKVYQRMIFQGVGTSSYQTGGSSHSDVGSTDQISLNYSTISLEYMPLRSDGNPAGPTVQGGWDLKANKAWSPPGSISGSGSGGQGGGGSSGGAVSEQVPPATTSPIQTPVKTMPSIISPKPIRVK